MVDRPRSIGTAFQDNRFPAIANLIVNEVLANEVGLPEALRYQPLTIDYRLFSQREAISTKVPTTPLPRA